MKEKTPPITPTKNQKELPPDISALDEISGFLTRSDFNMERLLNDIIGTATDKMGIKAGAIRLMDPSSGDLVIKAFYGLSSTFLSLAPVFDNQSRFSRLIQNRGVLQILDISREPDLSFAEAARAEGIVSLLAIGLFKDDEIIGALSVYTNSQHEFAEFEIRTLRIIANYASIALHIASLHNTEMEAAAIRQELELAASIQAGVLPKRMPVMNGVEISANSIPWQKVGGDFFDFIEISQQNLGIAIADVSGKGISAALLMFAVRMALRSHVEHEYHAHEIIRLVNNAICKDTQSDQFATLFYGVLNVPAKILTYVNAGHPPPLLFRGHTISVLETGGIPTGILSGYVYQEESISLKPGDVLVFYTDGYTDISNDQGEFFEVEQFQSCVSSVLDLSPEGIISTLDHKVSEFVAGTAVGDDRTIIVLKAT